MTTFSKTDFMKSCGKHKRGIENGQTATTGSPTNLFAWGAGDALWMRYLMTTLCLLALTVAQMWGLNGNEGTSITIYASAAGMFDTEGYRDNANRPSWDKNNSTLKIKVRRADNDWTTETTMTKTDKTYHGFPVYSYTFKEKYDGGEIQFKHYISNTWKEDYGTGWQSTSDLQNKLYTGYSNNQHNFITPTYDTQSTYTVYYACTNSENYTLKANLLVSNKYNSWEQVAMTKTDKTYNGTPIYSCTITDYQNGAKTFQFQRYQGDTWKDQVEIFKDSWKEKSTFAGKLYDGTTWVDYAYDVTITPQTSGGQGSVSPNTAQTFLNTSNKQFTATASTGYKFKQWQTTTGLSLSTTTETTTTVTATQSGTLTAVFEALPSGTLTVAATTGGQVSLDNSTWTSSSVDKNNITTATTINIYAKANTGYEFVNWTTTGDGSINNANQANTTYNATAGGTATVTANFKETTYAVTVSSQAGGTVTTGTGEKQVGQINAVNITASPNTGYTFKRWETTGSVTVADPTTTTTTMTATGTGTVTATFEENLSTQWTLYSHNAEGKNKQWENNNGSKNLVDKGSARTITATTTDFKKATGHAAESVAYAEVELQAGDVLFFKVVKDYSGSPATWYGNSWNISSNATDWGFSTDDGDCVLNASVPGIYSFKIDFSGENPSVSVTYPELSNCIRGSWDAWAWTNTLNASGEVEIDLAAETEYEFLVYYNNNHYRNAGKIISATNNSASSVDATSGANMKIETTIAGKYKFTYASNTLTVDYPDIPAMTGTLTLAESTITGKKKAVAGEGTSANPYIIFEDGQFDLQATHTDKPTDDSHFKYTFSQNNVEKQTIASDGTSPRLYNMTAESTASNDNKTITVSAYYEYGPTGYTVKGTALTSTVYYKVIAKPTVTISNLDSEIIQKGIGNITISTTNTDTYTAQYLIQYRKWNGSSWSETWTNAGAETTLMPTTITLDNNMTEGFYQWRVRLTYGEREFYSNIVQNCIYKTYQVTIKGQDAEKASWFQYVYAWRSDNTDLTPTSNSGYQYKKDCCVEVEDNVWVYEFKYPIYKGMIISDGQSGSNENKSNDLTITSNTCLTITGGNSNRWTLNQDNTCSSTYYRISSTLGANTYYSNVVTDTQVAASGGATISFWSPKKDEGTIYIQKLENGHWTNQNGSMNYNGKGLSTATVVTATLSNTSSPTLSDFVKYTDNLYIRSDAATGGWNNYTNDNYDNKMTYFEANGQSYNYYWVKYVGEGENNSDAPVNIDAEIANDINKCLSRRLAPRGGLTDSNGKVAKKNLRYSYNLANGWLDFAIIGESTAEHYVFLSTYGADSNNTTESTKVFQLKSDNTKGNATTEATASTQVKFIDLSNWVYQADVWVKAPNGTTDDDNVTIGVEARLADSGTAQNLVPRENPLEILGKNTNGGDYIIRVLYDYKTNTVTTGWLPKNEETITESVVIEGNMILNRVENNSVQQVKMQNASAKVTSLQRMYMAMEIQKTGEWTTNNGAENYLFYWISLPYDCYLKDIFGLPGTYLDTWGIQYYDGMSRAQNGWFLDVPSKRTYWKWVYPYEKATGVDGKYDYSKTGGEGYTDAILHANVGYVLTLALDADHFKSIKMSDGTTKSSLYLYFPSSEAGYTLQQGTASVVLPEYSVSTFTDSYIATKRPDRDVYDRDWHLFGLPGFTDLTSATLNPAWSGDTYNGNPKFYYKYVYSGGDPGSSLNNQYVYTATTGTFQAFQSFMVQYHGTVTWSNTYDTEQQRQSIRARMPQTDKKMALNGTTLNLLLEKEGMIGGETVSQQVDNTFISMSANATEKVNQSLDLTKIFNNGCSQLYSLAEGIELAANVLPVDSQVVPLGVVATSESNYTFRLADELPTGMTALLIDYEEETLTDLGLQGYTTTIAAGNQKERFALRLVIDEQNITTDLSHKTSNGVSATIVDDQLLISGAADGTAVLVYDPSGRLLYNGITQTGKTITLPTVQGIYLINIGNETIKVVR